MKKSVVLLLSCILFMVGCGSKNQDKTDPKTNGQDPKVDKTTTSDNSDVDTNKEKRGFTPAAKPGKVEGVKLETKPSVKILAIRLRTNKKTIKAQITAKLKEIRTYMETQGEKIIFPVGACFYSGDTRNLDTEVFYIVSKKIPGKGEITYKEMPETKGVSTIHKGSFSKIKEAYSRTSEFIIKNGHKSLGTSCELYYADPETTDENDMKTQVFIPIK
jgi:effector-binding domain-containing protein